MKKRNVKVIIIKDGKAKEIDNLPDEILSELDKAYEATPIKGLSRESYAALAELFANKLKNYEHELEKVDKKDLFSKSVAFASAFEVFPDETPIFFDLMLQVERMVNEQKNFDSKKICIKNLRNLVNRDWKIANKDFRRWARKLFDDTNLKIGIIRMMKFFFGVITTF